MTRNRGTVCGSIAHADSAAELPLALVALGGEVVTSRRTIPAAEFFVTHFTTTLDPDELVIATGWPRLQPGRGSAFEEFAVRHGDFALASAACVLHVEEGQVTEARLAVGSVTTAPSSSTPARSLDTQSTSRLRTIAAAVAASIDPPPNLHGPRTIGDSHRGLVERVVSRAWAAAS